MLDKIKTIKEFALFLGIGERKLLNLDPENSYCSFYVNKPGKTEKRLIEYPKGELATVRDLKRPQESTLTETSAQHQHH